MDAKSSTGWLEAALLQINQHASTVAPDAHSD
jgi:hypothetical protein